jgi:hypothetical protein
LFIEIQGIGRFLPDLVVGAQNRLNRNWSIKDTEYLEFQVTINRWFNYYLPVFEAGVTANI